jgi:hypothetical protein
MMPDRHQRLDVPGRCEIHGSKQAAMITHTTVQARGQAQQADLHDQARRDALIRAARRPRRQRSRAVLPGANPAANDLRRQTEKGDERWLTSTPCIAACSRPTTLATPRP